MVLPMISLLLHAIQRYRSTTQQRAADTRTAVGVNITNTQELALQHGYAQEAVLATASASYDIAGAHGNCAEV